MLFHSAKVTILKVFNDLILAANSLRHYPSASLLLFTVCDVYI